MAEEGPRNRRERRAAARESGKPMAAPTSSPRLKLAQPDRSKPKSKTLLDLYDEKKALLDQGQPFDPKHNDGLARDESGNILEAGLGDGDPIGPVGQAIFWAISLSMIHFTLDVLVYHQYRQEIEWKSIVIHTATVLPILFVVIWMLGSETAKQFSMLRQVFFLVLSVAAGCHTIHVTNRYDYYYVMQNTPALGTLWIWSVIEMKLPFAAASVMADLAYLWYKGYTIT